jgi:predicted phage tail component-like protein
MDYSKYCALTYNGVLLDDVIDGYMTINVDGRGIRSPSLNVVTVPGRNGSLVLSQQYPPIIMTVYFLLKAPDDKTFRAKLGQLHELLKSEDDVKFSFGDETGYRIGRLSDVSNPPYDQNQGVGSFTIYCQTPLLYMEDQQQEFTGSVSISETVQIIQLEVTLSSPAESLRISNRKDGSQLIVLDSFLEGDVVVVDFTSNTVTKNNSNISQKVDFTKSSFVDFKYPEGLELVLEPSATAKILYREVQK